MNRILALPLLCAAVVMDGCAHNSASASSVPPLPSETVAPQPVAADGGLTRDDWMVVPGRHGGREVITRTQYLDDRAKHARPKMPSLSAAPPTLMNVGAGFGLSVGQIRSYKIIDEPVKRMRVTGTAVRVYWSTPYFIQRIEHGKFIDHPGADVHIEGVEAGQSELILEMIDGTSRTFEIQVHGPAGTAQRS